MGELFGTDGIRGKANTYPLTPEMAVRIGKAIAAYFKAQNGDTKIVVGKDTRLSGDMLENAVISGICSQGVHVSIAGVVPTPAVAYLTASHGADAGIMISASHNPYYDNGIKVFNGDGFKLDDNTEAEIEQILLENSPHPATPPITETGRVSLISNAALQYTDFLMNQYNGPTPLNGMRIVLDCSNGATHEAAPLLFRRLSSQVDVLFASPDGKNINAQCGSQHPQALQQTVLAHKADIGLAFDGDGDRLIAVDNDGGVTTGDQILYICAKMMKDVGVLANNLAVSTVMSNMGLGVALKEQHIDHLITQVGDRYVLKRMREKGAVIGGEDSGHMIFLHQHTTGDGMLTALKLIEAIMHEEKSLSELKQKMPVYPQILVNVPVTKKPSIDSIPELMDAIELAEAQLAGKGRVLVRYSGTQPLCRVMVEASSKSDMEKHCRSLVDIVKATIGKP